MKCEFEILGITEDKKYFVAKPKDGNITFKLGIEDGEIDIDGMKNRFKEETGQELEIRIFKENEI